MPGAASAKDGPPGADGLPVAPAKHPWKFFSGDHRIDTLAYSCRKVHGAGRRQLEEDGWTMLVSDPARGVVVTKWKQIHHPLLWLFMGKTMARVTVEVESLGVNRTRVVFHGDLASHHSLNHNPMFPAAKRAYAKAAANWKRDVLADLTSSGKERTDPGASSRARDP